MGKVDTRIPVIFQKLNAYDSEDTRFLRVKIWLMHTEENLNGSYFEKSVVEDAIPSLANTPILAYIEDNSNGDKDFSDHRMILVREDGDVKIKYIGQAIGVIPEENNAQFETRLCDDGIEREFLTVDGLVWTKWDDPIDIFNRDIIKSQSMELHDEYEGEFKEDGLFHFSKFKFFGACALGSDMQPAMRSATVEAQFSSNVVFNEIQNKMEQFKSLVSIQQKGGVIMDEKVELLNKYSLTEESLKDYNIKLDDYSVEDLEEKLKELTSKKDDIFSLSAKQLRQEIKAELYKEKSVDDWGYEWHKYWYVDHDDNMVIAEDSENNDLLVGFNYSVNNNKINIDFNSKTRVAINYIPFESDEVIEFDFKSKDKVDYDLKIKEKELEKTFTADKEKEIKNIKSELDKINNHYAEAQKEIEELRNFKNSKLEEERKEEENELFERFSAELTEDEINEIKQSSSEFTIEQLEEKLYTLVGKKKATFSKQTKKDKKSVKVDIEFDEHKTEDKPYGELFDKYATN